MKYGNLILRTPTGRYHWQPILSCLYFIPKGKRSWRYNIEMPEDENTILGAIKYALRDMDMELTVK